MTSNNWSNIVRGKEKKCNIRVFKMQFNVWKRSSKTTKDYNIIRYFLIFNQFLLLNVSEDLVLNHKLAKL